MTACLKVMPVTRGKGSQKCKKKKSMLEFFTVCVLKTVLFEERFWQTLLQGHGPVIGWSSKHASLHAHGTFQWWCL